MTWTELLPLDAEAEAAITARVAAVSDAAERAVAADKPHSYTHFPSTECGQLVAALPREELQALALWAQEQVGRTSYAIHRLHEDLSGRSLGLTPAEVAWMLRRTRAYPHALRLPLKALQRLDDEALRAFQPALVALTDKASGSTADGRRLVQRIRALLDRVDPAEAADALPPDLLNGGDRFGPAATALLADPGPGIAPLVMLCATAGSQVSASKRWNERARALLDAAPDGPDTVRALLRLFCAQEVRSRTETDYFGERQTVYEFVHENNVTLVRGLVWAAALLPGEKTTALLAEVAEVAAADLTPRGKARCPRVASSATAALEARAVAAS